MVEAAPPLCLTTESEGRMIGAWVNDYVDELGQPAGILLSLAPRLHLVLEGAQRNYKPLHSVGSRCSRCRQPITGRNLYPHPLDLRMLGCDCLTVLFGAEGFNQDWVLSHWTELRRIKRDAESQLAAEGN